MEEYEFVVTEARTLVANFELNTYEITVTANPATGGTVTGAGVYDHGTAATLTATANENYTFINWTKDGEEVSTDETYGLVVTETGEYVANFELNTYEITATANPAEGGFVTGEGIYDYGTVVTMMAISNEGYTFVNWTEDGEEVSIMEEYEFVVTEARTLVANFVESSGITQTSTFASGWTWWSAYVELSDMDGLELLEDGLGPNGSLIKSQTSFVSNNVGEGWSGSLEGINNESCYLVNAISTTEVSLIGAKAMPNDHPVTLNPGWTWIGYVNTVSMSVEEAVAGITPSDGDMLKSQQSFASYSATQGWNGSLSTLEPGKGYMYLSKNSTPVTLIYPDEPMRGELKENITSEHNHWRPDMQAYPDNMSVMAVVELDGVELHDGEYELAAFAEGECRGSVRLAEVNGRHIAFLTVMGDTPQNLSLRLYDAKTGQEWIDAEEAMTFTANAVIGGLEVPIVIHFRGNTSVEESLNSIQLFPNPVGQGEEFSIGIHLESNAPIKVEVISTLGSVISTEVVTKWPLTCKAPLVSGVYTLRITAKGVNTCVKKLVVR